MAADFSAPSNILTFLSRHTVQQISMIKDLEPCASDAEGLPGSLKNYSRRLS
jgi:hypothetical protein